METMLLLILLYVLSLKSVLHTPFGALCSE